MSPDDAYLVLDNDTFKTLLTDINNSDFTDFKKQKSLLDIKTEVNCKQDPVSNLDSLCVNKAANNTLGPYGQQFSENQINNINSLKQQQQQQPLQQRNEQNWQKPDINRYVELRQIALSHVYHYNCLLMFYRTE